MRFFLRDGSRSRYTLSLAGWVLTTFTTCYLLAVKHFRSASARDPSSYFFNPTYAYEKQYSLQRIAEAETFIAAAQDALTQKAHTAQAPYMCIGVATIGRRGEQYVHLTVGSILAGLSAEQRENVFLTLLIGHTDPAKHPIANDPWVEKLPDKMLKYDPDGVDWTQIKAWEDEGWYRNKTIYDYTYLLKDCLDTGAQYVAVFEDDVLAKAGWFDRVHDALSQVEKAMATRSKEEHWIYLRLFYSDDLLGWNSEEWPKYLLWSVMVWLVATGSLLALKHRLGRTTDMYMTNSEAIGLSTICVALAIALHFMAGRHTTHPLSPGVHEMNRYGCCSQGLIFPRSIVPDLLSQTDLTTDWLVDMMIEKIANEHRWTRWAVVPSILQHIGAVSSKGYGFDDTARTLWSFRFEEWIS